MSKLMEYQEYSAQLERESDVGRQFGAVLRAAKVGWVAQDGGRRTPRSGLRTPPSSSSNVAHEDAHTQLASLQKRLARLTSHVDDTLNTHVYRGVTTPPVSRGYGSIPSRTPSPHIHEERGSIEEKRRRLEVERENAVLREELASVKAANEEMKCDKQLEMEGLRSQLNKTIEGNEKHIACITQSDTTHKLLAEELKTELNLVRDARQKIEATMVEELRKEVGSLKVRNTELEKKLKKVTEESAVVRREDAVVQAALRKDLKTARDTVKKLTEKLNKKTTTPTRVVTTETVETMRTTRRTPSLPKQRRRGTTPTTTTPTTTTPNVPVEYHHMANPLVHELRDTTTPTTINRVHHNTTPVMVDKVTSPIGGSSSTQHKETEVQQAMQAASNTKAEHAKRRAAAGFDVVRCTQGGTKVPGLGSPLPHVSSSPVGGRDVVAEDATLSPGSRKLQDARRVAAEKRLKVRGSHSPGTPQEDDLESAWFSLTKRDNRVTPPSIPQEVIEVLKAPEFPHVSDTETEGGGGGVPPPSMEVEATLMFENWKKKFEEEEREEESNRRVRREKEAEDELVAWRARRREEELKSMRVLEDLKRKQNEEAKAAEEMLRKQKEELSKLNSEIDTKKADLKDGKEQLLAELKEELKRPTTPPVDPPLEPLPEKPIEKEPDFSDAGSTSTSTPSPSEASTPVGPTLVKDEDTGGVVDGGVDTSSELLSTPLASPEGPGEEVNPPPSAHEVVTPPEMQLEKSSKSADLFSTLGVRLPSPASSEGWQLKEKPEVTKELLETVLAKRSPRGRPPASPQVIAGRGSPLSLGGTSPSPVQRGRGRGRGRGFRSPSPSRGTASVPSTPRSVTGRSIAASVLNDTTTTPRASPGRLPPTLQLKQLLSKGGPPLSAATPK